MRFMVLMIISLLSDMMIAAPGRHERVCL